MNYQKLAKVLFQVASVWMLAVTLDGGTIGVGVGKPSIRFDAFIIEKNNSQFIVSLLDSEGRLTSRAWLNLGQSFGGYTLLQFHEKEEAISVKDPSGKILKVNLVESRVHASTGVGDSFSRGMEAVAKYRLENQVKGELLGDFRIDVDGHTMPPEALAQFRAERERQEASGNYCVGMFVNGRWQFMRVGVSKMIKEKDLSDSEHRKLEAAWMLAMAEVGGGKLVEMWAKKSPSTNGGMTTSGPKPPPAPTFP